MNPKHIYRFRNFCLYMMTLSTLIGFQLTANAGTGEQTAEQLPGNPDLPSSAADIKALIELGKQKQKYQVDDFLRDPEQSGYQISPDGDYFSYLAPYENRMNIHVQEVGSDEVTRLTSFSDRSVAGYTWATNDRLIYIKDDGGDENFQLYAVDRDGSNDKDLTPFEGVRIQMIDDLKDKPDEMIIGMNKENPMLFEPYRINIQTGELVKLAENKDPLNPISGWMTDHDGKLRIASQVTGGTNARILYRDTEADEFKTVVETDFRVSLNPLAFDENNSHIVYMSSNLDRDKSALVRFDMHSGKETEEVFSHEDVDVTNLFVSRRSRKPVLVSYTTDKRHRHYIDPVFEKHYNRLEEALEGYEVVVTSMTDKEDKWLVRTFSDRSLGAYYLYDLNSDGPEKLVEVSPWIDEADMAEMRPIQYKSRDGLTIHGYLTVPKTAGDKAVPLVVNPHGGPWVRDNWGWDPVAQLLAQQGYAVFQPNYRGSTGYGRAFWESSFKQWGQKMQEDVTDGVNYLVEEGIADKDKVAIYGGSYGGYATLAGLAYSPEVYVCGVDFVGVSNLFTFLETIPPYWKPFLEMMYEMVGHPEEDKEMLTAYSPALNSDKIQVPLFVAQGANDPRVNIDESDQIVTALRNRGVDVPYMVKYDEGHGFRNEENRIEFYEAMIGFLAKHLD